MYVFGYDCSAYDWFPFQVTTNYDDVGCMLYIKWFFIGDGNQRYVRSVYSTITTSQIIRKSHPFCTYSQSMNQSYQLLRLLHSHRVLHTQYRPYSHAHYWTLELGIFAAQGLSYSNDSDRDAPLTSFQYRGRVSPSPTSRPICCMCPGLYCLIGASLNSGSRRLSRRSIGRGGTGITGTSTGTSTTLGLNHI